MVSSIRIPSEFLEDNRLVDVLKSVLASPEVVAKCCGVPMVLPQGLDLFKPTKLVFINDDNGIVKDTLVELFSQN